MEDFDDAARQDEDTVHYDGPTGGWRSLTSITRIFGKEVDGPGALDLLRRQNKPEGFMSPVHISPREAVQASVDLGARHSVPMHYGTFRLADDGETEPLWDLAGALVERGAQAPKWWVLGFGEGRDVPP